MVFDEKKWRKLVLHGNVCVGVSSLTSNGQHIVMLDYDKISLEKVIRDIHRLQKIFKLGDAALIKTRNGFHVYTISPKFEYPELCEVIWESRCDEWFKNEECRRNMRQVILRISARGKTPPPEFITIVQSCWSGRFQASLAHWIFLKWFYGAPLKYPAYNDGSNKILVYLYKTLRN